MGPACSASERWVLSSPVSTKSSKSAKGEAGPDFETAMRELEGIVDLIERGEIGLERSMAEYERGMALVRRCRAILATAEQKVEELSRQAGTSGGGEGRSGEDDSTSKGPKADLPF